MMRQAVGTGILAVMVLALPGQAEYEAGQRAWEAGRHGEALTAAMTQQRVAQAQPGSVPPPPPEVVVEAQTLLTGLGYEPGPVNGVWNERTKQAYRKFLRDKDLPAGETLTPAVLETLRSLARFGCGPGGEAARPSAKATGPAALHRAAKAGNLEGLNAALVAGADVNARDGRSWTALMHAVNKGYVLLVEPLLAAKADPNLRAPDGATALFMASAHGHTEIIGLLMKAGADPTITGPKGKTAGDVARTRYGDAAAARQKNADPAVLALLAGKMWAEMKADEDAAAFARADAAATAAAYTEYLAAFPQGRHADEVQRRVEELKSLLRKWPVGKKFRDCESCPEMVVVPAGSYMMGSPALEAERDDDEGPVHRVTIAQPFAVGVYEVTRGEFGRFVGATGYSTVDRCWTFEDGKGKERSGRGWKNPGFEHEQGEREPVVCVSWDDAQAYVRWLSEETGEAYRLLSEAEWEYVARAGTTTARYWGESEAGQCRYANGADAGTGFEWAESCHDGHARTAPVGRYEANAFGLYDVLGNVWEWTQDCWNKSYAGAPSNGGAWESGNCSWRVLRGGSWGIEPGYLRSAVRDRSTAGNRNNGNGFRLARTLTS